MPKQDTRIILTTKIDSKHWKKLKKIADEYGDDLDAIVSTGFGLYQWARTAQKKGYEIGRLKGNVFTPLEIPKGNTR